MRVKRAEWRRAEPCTEVRPDFAQLTQAARPSGGTKSRIGIVEQHNHEQRSRDRESKELAVAVQGRTPLGQPLGVTCEAKVEKRDQAKDLEAEVAVIEVAGIL